MTILAILPDDRQRSCRRNPNSLGYSVPQVFREHGFVFTILLPPREHPPPHVHVTKGEGELILTLNPLIGVREVRGMASADVVRAFRIAEERQAELLEKWNEHHG